MLRCRDEHLRSYGVIVTALHSLERARPPCTSHRRYRRRGLRSSRAIARRANRIQDDIDPVPLGGGLCESGPLPPVLACCFAILHCNVRGLLSKLSEVNTRIARMPNKPSILCLAETWLNNSAGTINITGYLVVVRRDRDDGRSGGGVLILAAASIVDNIAPLLISSVAERVWCLLHSNLGPMLICCWYRPPDRGETSSIQTLRAEFLELRPRAISTFIIGDMNVHNTRWLRHSRGNSLEGNRLHRFCLDFGFRERVCAPTRGKYLLDLVLSDVDNLCRCSVLPYIADHACVLLEVDMQLAISSPVIRKVWNYGAANWKRMSGLVGAEDWSILDTMDPNSAAELIQRRILFHVSTCVPIKTIVQQRGTHPWLNARCLELVDAKMAAEGTENYKAMVAACSKGLFDEYLLYTQRVKEKLKKLPSGSKRWWKLSHNLLLEPESNCCIPPLLKPDENWALSSEAKANLFADTLPKKWILPPRVNDERIEYQSLNDYFVPVRMHVVLSFLKSLEVNSAAGPDGMAAIF